ncbi:Uncharacterised protein [Segatella copri]|nr:Uncharacterised protein [Segatella copri]
MLLKLWCKGKNFYDKGQGINAEPLTFLIKRVWQCVALGGNRNTAYSHALFTYNQRVKCIGDRCSNKNRKTFSYKNHKGRSKPLFALPFACIDNCAEIMNFIMRTHPLHFTTSSTSLS